MRQAAFGFFANFDRDFERAGLGVGPFVFILPGVQKYTGIIDQDVKPAEFFSHPLFRFHDAFLLADIQWKQAGFAFRAELFNGGASFFLVTAGKKHVKAFFCELAAGFKAQAAVAAGD
jgi:hypothetical protein